MPIYNKLVRDKIPQIIEENGKSFRTRILSTEEYRSELQIKLREEAEEYFLAKNTQEALEEMADMLEVISSISRGAWGKLGAARSHSAQKSGSPRRLRRSGVFNRCRRHLT